MPHAVSMLNISSIKGENNLVSAERERVSICLSVFDKNLGYKLKNARSGASLVAQ